MEMTTEVESPRQWIWWSSICAIAAVAGSNTFLDHYYYKLSPNMFVMLLGKSGLGKGFPIWLAKELVTLVDSTRVISGRNSIENVVKDLGTVSSRPGKSPIPDSRGFLVSGEFVNFLVQNPSALQILTELYDTHYSKTWKNSMKNAGVDVLKNPCLTMLGASSPTHYKDAVSESDIEGGYAARTLHIYEDRRGHINPLVRAPERAFVINDLVKHLREISQVSGEFHYSPSAGDYFETWYRQLRRDQDSVIDDTGLDQRLHNHVDKVAMCLSLSRRTDLIISVEDIEEAILACKGLMVDVRKANIGTSKEEITKLMGDVIRVILSTKDHSIPKARLLSRLWGRGLNTMNLAVIQDTLIESRIATCRNSSDDMHFELTESYVEEVYRLQKEKRHGPKND